MQQHSESQKHHAKWKQTSTEVWFHLYKLCNRQKLTYSDKNKVGTGKGLTENEHREI